MPTLALSLMICPSYSLSPKPLQMETSIYFSFMKMQISEVPQPSGVRKLHWGTTTRRWQLTLPTLQLMFSPQLAPPQCAAQVWTSSKVHRLRVRNVSLILFHLLPAKKPRPRMFLQQSDHCKVSLHTSEKAEPFRAGHGGLARLFTDNWNQRVSKHIRGFWRM